MRVLISVDIEGVAGVFHPEQTRPGNGEYERARGWMTQEANAAIAGAFDAGASDVLVNDSHGHFRNMPADLLDPRARVVQGKPRYLGMAAGVEQVAEASLRLLVGVSEQVEHPCLLVAVVDTDRACGKLETVAHDIVGRGPHSSGVGVEQVGVLGHRGSERVVYGVPPALSLVPLDQGRVDHPRESEYIVVGETKSSAHVGAKAA